MNNFKNSLHDEAATANTAFKPMYKCGVCGTIHESIADRAHCELLCVAKEEEAAKKAAEEKKKAEQAARKKELDTALAKAEELLNKYVEDYGFYKAERSLYLDLEDAIDGLFRRLP
jgi:hypothetical protein